MPCEANNGEAAILRFLSALSQTGNVGMSCRTAKLSRRYVSGLLQADTDFSDAYTQAMEDAHDLLCAEARRRAVKGIVLSTGKPSKAKPGAQSRKFSDPLLMLLIRQNGTAGSKAAPIKADAPDVGAILGAIARDADPITMRLPS